MSHIRSLLIIIMNQCPRRHKHLRDKCHPICYSVLSAAEWDVDKGWGRAVTTRFLPPSGAAPQLRKFSVVIRARMQGRRWRVGGHDTRIIRKQLSVFRNAVLSHSFLWHCIITHWCERVHRSAGAYGCRCCPLPRFSGSSARMCIRR